MGAKNQMKYFLATTSLEPDTTASTLAFFAIALVDEENREYWAINANLNMENAFGDEKAEVIKALSLDDTLWKPCIIIGEELSAFLNKPEIWTMNSHKDALILHALLTEYDEEVSFWNPRDVNSVLQEARANNLIPWNGEPAKNALEAAKQTKDIYMDVYRKCPQEPISEELKKLVSLQDVRKLP